MFHEQRLHEAFFDENLCVQIAVARRITACYSRGRNRAVGNENTCFSEKNAPKLGFLPRGERNTAQPYSNRKNKIKLAGGLPPPCTPLKGLSARISMKILKIDDYYIIIRLY